jgi:hypothetical protein
LNIDKINTPFKVALALVVIFLLMLIVSKAIWKQSFQYYDYIFILAGIVTLLVAWLKTNKK